MHRQNPTLRSLSQIHEEILMEEILPRLPVRSLLRFKCVSRSWLSLIDSDRFIKIQYQNSAKNPSSEHHRVAISYKDELSSFSLQSLLNSNRREGSPITGPKIGSLVGCCNGVICFSDEAEEKRLFLWNPATRVSIELPKTDLVRSYNFSKYGFGWDESSGAYKVFVGMTVRKLDVEQPIGIVYSSKTNSWRTVEHGALRWIDSIAQFVSGKLHWITLYDRDGGDKYYIESMDLESEEFGRVELPSNVTPRVQFNMPWLGQIGGCLGMLFDNWNKSLEVWVMKEYGVKDSWLKLFTFPLTAPDVCLNYRYGFRVLFEEGPNGEIFITDGGTILVYSPKNGAFSTAKNTVLRFFEALIYVESLVSPLKKPQLIG